MRPVENTIHGLEAVSPPGFKGADNEIQAPLARNGLLGSSGGMSRLRAKQADLAAHVDDRRRRTRHNIQLPILVLDFPYEGEEYLGKTRNISSGSGVCFNFPCSIPLKQNIRYVITLSAANPLIKIACAGRIVRTTPRADGGFDLAATMERYWFLR